MKNIVTEVLGISQQPSKVDSRAAPQSDINCDLNFKEKLSLKKNEQLFTVTVFIHNHHQEIPDSVWQGICNDFQQDGEFRSTTVLCEFGYTNIAVHCNFAGGFFIAKGITSKSSETLHEFIQKVCQTNVPETMYTTMFCRL